MRIGLSSFLYCNYPLAEAVRRIAGHGYEGIDIWGGRPHAYRDDLGPAELAGLRRLIAEAGLGIASIIPAQFRYPTCLCSGMDAIRTDSIAYISKAIEIAAALGSPLVSVCPGHTLFGQSREDGWGRLADSLDRICRHAAGYGVRVAIEPADAYETDLIGDTSLALRMIEELGHDNLGVVLDNGHAFVVGESSIEAIERLGSRLFHVHIDDNAGARDQHLVPGDGAFDFSPFIAALRGSGYDGYLSAELSWDYTTAPDIAAARTASALRTMIA